MRPSGTEDIVRVYAEAATREVNNKVIIDLIYNFFRFKFLLPNPDL